MLLIIINFLFISVIQLSCCGIDGPSDWSSNGDFIWNNDGRALPESCNCDSTQNDNCGIASTFAYNYTDANNMIQTAYYNSTNDVWTDVSYMLVIDSYTCYT